MRLRIVLATVSAVAFVLPAQASAKPADDRRGDRDCTSRLFREVARKAYQPWWAQIGRRAQMARLKRCAPNQATLEDMVGIQQNLLGGRREAIANYERLTPYPGPGRTRWAIPWYIVACESGGRWNAYNPSGAAGPYQIMAEWGRPFPVASHKDKMTHHRLASRIWAGGAGRSNWVC